MTQTIGTDGFPQNDIYLGSNGNLVILQGQPAVEAACQSASLLRLGEAILSTTTGIPFEQAVWIGTPNLAVYENYLRTAILNVDGVIAIQSLTVSVSQNKLSYTATIQSVFGLAEIISAEIPV
jgi:hypothetical protein